MKFTRKEKEEWQGKNRKRIDFVSYYAYKEGVFLSPNNKWVARVRKGEKKKFTTISQHDTQEDAQKAYDTYYLCYK